MTHHEINSAVGFDIKLFVQKQAELLKSGFARLDNEQETCATCGSVMPVHRFIRRDDWETRVSVYVCTLCEYGLMIAHSIWIKHQVYLDEKHTLSKRYKDSSHLWCQNVDKLHEFAQSIGLKREWFQDRPGFPHYDVFGAIRLKAIQKGAVEIADRRMVELVNLSKSLGDGT